MTQIRLQAMPTIIAQTERWLVLAKPAGWLSIPGRGESLGVLSDWATSEIKSPVWTVHRLDRETSGVILFALSEKAHQEANRWFAAHTVKKIYDCLAEGLPRAPVLKLNGPVEGRKSLTQIEVKELYQEGFLAQVRPLTGRRHQIRIHLSGEGHPIWGDTLYKGAKEIRIKTDTFGVPRVALHARRLELPGGEKYECPWPHDFSEWVERLRKGGTRV